MRIQCDQLDPSVGGRERDAVGNASHVVGWSSARKQEAGYGLKANLKTGLGLGFGFRLVGEGGLSRQRRIRTYLGRVSLR